MNKNNKTFNLLDRFLIEGKILSIKPFGEGHINLTFLVETDKKKYILQRINDYVFSDVEGLMNNIYSVTAHLHKKGVETLPIVLTKDGKTYIYDEEPYRVYEYIDNTTTYQSIPNARIFENIGAAFGAFQNQLADYDATTLVEVIPDFHNTPKRFENLEKAISADVKHRARSCVEEIKFFFERKNTLSKVVDGLNDGSIPLRVTHNDTKINNILMDATTGEARAVIDLDTIMPGSLLYDFGDAVRFGANTAAEDERDLTKIGFDLELFKAYAKGFCGALKGSMTEKEKELLPYSVYLLTIEVAIRFLTDYLMGDVYFRIDYEDHNLIRAKSQIQFVKEIEKNMEKMSQIVKEL
ncbi:MAG: aminoglycoside phosphotransferase family protein [Clostridia bacterium]|nr:aminoglycoside phosphotransferase family protein [Clostridia bacterium]